MGADGRQAASTARRPPRGRSPRAADCRVGGVHTMTGRGAAPDFILRKPCLALIRTPGSGRFMALTYSCAPRAPGGPGAPDITQISNG
jgi:hypothetical protein